MMPWAMKCGHASSAPASSDWAFSIAVDGGGVYAAGFASAPLPGQAIGGSFVRKYDGSGNEVWTRQFGFTLAFGVAADAGGVYVSGLTFGTLPGASERRGPGCVCAQVRCVRKRSVDPTVRFQQY